MKEILANHYHPLVLAMTRLPLPVIAAVDGASAGIGCDIARRPIFGWRASGRFSPRSSSTSTSCPTAAVVHPVAAGRDGPSTGNGHDWLPRHGRGRRAVGHGQPCLPGRGFEDSVQKFAAHLAEEAPLSIAQSKKAIRHNDGTATLEQALSHEAATQQVLCETHDFGEGVMAFLEKRKPNYLGK